MIRIEEAIQLLKEHTSQIKEMLHIPLLDSYERVTSEDIYADISVPPYPKSAMDGYALRSVDTLGASQLTPAIFTVEKKVLAGDSIEERIQPMEAIRIMTGGMMPADSDFVVKQEDVKREGDKLSVYSEIMPYLNYCKAGEDIKKGAIAVSKHTKINSVHIGVLASIGQTRVSVFRPLKIGILSTGTELVMAGQEREKGQIFNSCAYVIASKIKAAGFEIAAMENEVDKTECLMKKIEGMEEVDIIITTGGVSVGEKDLMPEVMERLGAKQLFHGVNIKPGTPAMASYYKNKIVLSLSGNPFAALITFELFFWSIVEAALSTRGFVGERCERIYIGNTLKSNQLERYIRAVESDRFVSLYSEIHSSSVLSSLSHCNCFIVQPKGNVIREEDKVEIIKLNYR